MKSVVWEHWVLNKTKPEFFFCAPSGCRGKLSHTNTSVTMAMQLKGQLTWQLSSACRRNHHWLTWPCSSENRLSWQRPPRSSSVLQVWSSWFTRSSVAWWENISVWISWGTDRTTDRRMNNPGQTGRKYNSTRLFFLFTLQTFSRRFRSELLEDVWSRCSSRWVSAASSQVRSSRSAPCWLNAFIHRWGNKNVHTDKQNWRRRFRRLIFKNLNFKIKSGDSLKCHQTNVIIYF